jgi:hypothetical protein
MMNRLTQSAPALAGIVLAICCWGCLNDLAPVNAAAASDVREPYIGSWSNGRGDTLIITGSTIKFAHDKAVPYQDVTRVTNEREFQLQITSDAKLNYLTRFLQVSFGEGEKTDEMKITLYDSRKDMEAGENSQGEATWYRDK